MLNKLYLAVLTHQSVHLKVSVVILFSSNAPQAPILARDYLKTRR